MGLGRSGPRFARRTYLRGLSAFNVFTPREMQSLDGPV
jgi:hypothetical protein